MNDIICPYFMACSQIKPDSQGVQFSLLFLIFTTLVVATITLLLIFPIGTQINKTIGDIFLGIGAGIFAGTIFAFSIRVQTIMCLIYISAGLVFLTAGAVLKNFS